MIELTVEEYTELVENMNRVLSDAYVMAHPEPAPAEPQEVSINVGVDASIFALVLILCVCCTALGFLIGRGSRRHVRTS